MNAAHGRRPAWAILVVLAAASLGCSREKPPSPGRGPTPTSSAGAKESPVVAEVRAAELSRRAAAIDPSLHGSRDVAVRRAAAQALARIGDESTRSRLLRALADEDTQVVAWAASGLGTMCAGAETATVRALVARAASLAGEGRPEAPTGRFTVDAEEAISDALSRCGSGAAEHTLSAWLAGPVPRAGGAALALGRLAGRRQRLEDTTVVALLDAASREPPLGGAFAALSRLEGLPETTQARVLEVGQTLLARGGPESALVIRALASAGTRAAPVLASAVKDPARPPLLRTAAVTALSRLGSEGQAALSLALDTLVPAPEGMTSAAWPGALFPVLAAALSVLEVGAGPPDALARLAETPLPDALPAPERRRRVHLRCGAASILAGTASQSERLLRCDPDAKSRLLALATLRVLGRGDLTGARFERFRSLAEAADPAVRRAALSLVSAHPEMPPIVELLASALGAKEPGVVIQAARILAADPTRAAEPAEVDSKADVAPPVPAAPEIRRPPSPAVIDALARALDATRPPDEIETRAALARAAGALGALSLKPRVEQLCKHPNVTVRRGAESALRSFGVATASCPAPTDVPAPPFPVAIAPATLTFVTDATRLGVTIEPTLAPAAARRIVELARAGFYDGLPIHRVVPGSAVQLGDASGDGFGTAGKAPLPCETSPVSFEAFSVGMALAGRDTGSSQIFVTLVPELQLYGDYAKIGTADPEWATVAEGDLIVKVEVRD